MSLLKLTRHVGGILSNVLSHSSSICLSLNTARPTVLSASYNSLCRGLHSICITSRLPTNTNVSAGGKSLLQTVTDCKFTPQRYITLEYMHRKGSYKKQRKKKNSPLEGRPQLKGIVLKTLIKKPKKPNSANRKCVRLRLSTGKEAIAYVPGEGHNLQEHNIVLVQGGKLQDTPGVKLVCIRGKFDLPLVKKKA